MLAMIGSTTIQSQGVIYLVVAKLQVGTAVSFRPVSAYVILERPRKSGVRWRARWFDTPPSQPIDRKMSQIFIGLRIPGDSCFFYPIGILSRKHDLLNLFSQTSSEQERNLESFNCHNCVNKI